MIHPTLKKHFEEGKLAHAYFLIGEKGKIIDSLHEFVNFFFGELSSPDFFEYKREKFGIDDAHEIRRQASMKGFSQKGKIFLISANFFNYEAMTALLKIFEEPPPKTHFFIVSETSYALIPTLRSRLSIVNFESRHEASDAKKSSIEKFLKMTSPKRLLYLKDIMEDRDRSLDFLKNLEIVSASYFEKAVMEKKDFSLSALVREAGESRVLVFDYAPSRLVLERIALTLPRINTR